MGTMARIQEAVFRAIDEVNQHLPIETQLPKSPDSVLFGREGRLDSTGLVHLIVAIEQNLEDTFGVPFSLADDKALSQKSSPFRSVGSLIEYIGTLYTENDD